MKNNLIINVLAMVSLFATYAHASAGEADERWYIAPAFSYLASDSDRYTKDGYGLKLGIGKAISDNWDLEGSVSSNSFDIKNSSITFAQNSLGLDALYYFNRDAGFAPYVLFGAGVISTKVISEHSNAMINAGLGFKSELSGSGMALRTDLRYRVDLDDKTVVNQSSFGDWVFSLGLSFPLG